MLKLCLALPLFYPTFGGGPLRFLRYQPGLRKRDIHARVLAGTARRKDDFHQSADSRWQAHAVGSWLPIDQIEGTPVHRVRLPATTGVLRTSLYFRALIELCRNPATRPDVIQLHSFERIESLFWLPRLRRLEIPIVYAIQIARPVRHRSPLLRRMKHGMLHRFYDGFDGIVTNSDPIAAGLRDFGVRTPITTIPNGVDLAHFRPRHDPERRAEARHQLGIRGRGPVILCVGAICPRKGSDLLIEAWRRLLDRHPEAELLLVGPRHDLHNPNLHDFGRRVKSLIAGSPHPERVHLTGVRDDMNAVYAAADIVVLPSSREGMPNVVLEAMACERPVVLTPFAGQSASIGRPGLEFVACERTASALAHQLADLLDDPERRQALVRLGRRWVGRHLDLDTSLDRFADFYARAATGEWAPRALHPETEPALDAAITGARRHPFA